MAGEAADGGLDHFLGRRFARHEDVVQSDEAEDFLDARAHIAHVEGAARVVGGALKRNESGDAGGVNALNAAQVEDDVMLAHERRELGYESLIGSAHQFGHVVRGRDNDFIGVIEWGAHNPLRFLPCAPTAGCRIAPHFW